MAAVSALSVLDQCLDQFYRCPLKLMLHLQAEQSNNSGKLLGLARSEEQVNMWKIKYRAQLVSG